jgi:hypothetical protein
MYCRCNNWLINCRKVDLDAMPFSRDVVSVSRRVFECLGLVKRPDVLISSQSCRAQMKSRDRLDMCFRNVLVS